MKKVLLLVCTLIFFTTNNSVFSANESVIKKSNLIQKYLTDHKKKISLFARKYDVSNDGILDSKMAELDTLIFALQKIKESNIEEDLAKEKLTFILKRIKKINGELKDLLKKHKISFENKLNNKRQYYGRVSSRVSEQLRKVIVTLATNLPKEKLGEAAEHLRALEKESKKLKKFHEIPFSSTDEIQQGFLRILRTVRSELIAIKKIQAS